MFAARETATDCRAEVTRDMIELMLSQFDSLSDPEGIIQLELRGNCLMVLNPQTKAYEVVGLARLSPSMRKIIK